MGLRQQQNDSCPSTYTEKCQNEMRKELTNKVSFYKYLLLFIMFSYYVFINYFLYQLKNYNPYVR